MGKKHAVISLDGQWTMEGKNMTDGLTHKAYRPNYRPAETVPASVPGIVQTALYEAGIVEDPYFEDAPERIKWVEDKEWWFFKEFTVPDSIEGGNYVLVLEGITYRAEVWLNGVYVDRLEGMFTRWFLDVTDLLDPSGVNKLTLRIRTQEMASQDHPGSHIGRRVIMSTAVVAPFSYFWNWSPHMAPIGIWKPISLKVIGDAQLKDPFITTAIDWSDSDADQARSAKVSTSVELQSFTKRSKRVKVQGEIYAQDFEMPSIRFEQEVTLEPDTTVTVDLETVVDQPRLWWPNGMGEHPLYGMKLTVVDEAGEVQDELESEFGIRELTMAPNEDDIWVQDTCGHTNRPWSIVGNPYPWTFVVNRKRMFVRGTNWLPVDSLYRFTEDRYRIFLNQAEDANVNMVRVWGGGNHETETFYRMCNRKGILAWTEFWLACSSYPAMPHDLFVKCAIDMIKVLRNHPSVCLWSGGNEYNPDEPENKRLVDKLEAACNKYDPTRDFHRGSPYRGDRHGGMIMLPTRTTNKYSDLLSGESRLVLFRSEIAVMRSAPTIDNIKRFIGEDNIWPIDKKSWEYHHAKLAEQERDAKEYGGTGDLQHWLMSGHLTHGQNHRHNMEYCRQNKYHTSGCMQWQLNGSWPSFHRELIDWYGAPKPAFFAYKRAMQDTLVVADMEKYIFDGNETFMAKVYAVTDKYEDIGDVTIKATIYDRDMNALHEQSGQVFLPADASAHAYDIAWKVPGDYLQKVFFLHLEMTGAEGQLSENFYWMGTSPYSQPAERLDLSGSDWKVQSGTSRGESWKATKVPGRPYRIRQIDEAAFHLVGGLVESEEANTEGFAVYYTKQFQVPAAWKGIALEFFSAGLEGDDEVYVNGVKIGVTKGKKNQLFQSDPYKTPNLAKCFYPIPEEVLNWDEDNTIEIKLFGENVTGISEAVYIRKASTVDQKQALIDFDNEGSYLADMGQLESVQLELKLKSESTFVLKPGESANLEVSLHNPTERLAFFTGLRVKGLEDEASEFYSDNYFSLLPGEEKIVIIKLTHDRGFTGDKKLQIENEGWNMPTTQLDTEIDLTLR